MITILTAFSTISIYPQPVALKNYIERKILQHSIVSQAPSMQLIWYFSCNLTTIKIFMSKLGIMVNTSTFARKNQRSVTIRIGRAECKRLCWIIPMTSAMGRLKNSWKILRMMYSRSDIFSLINNNTNKKEWTILIRPIRRDIKLSWRERKTVKRLQNKMILKMPFNRPLFSVIKYQYFYEVCQINRSIRGIYWSILGTSDQIKNARAKVKKSAK